MDTLANSEDPDEMWHFIRICTVWFAFICMGKCFIGLDKETFSI